MKKYFITIILFCCIYFLNTLVSYNIEVFVFNSSKNENDLFEVKVSKKIVFSEAKAEQYLWYSTSNFDIDGGLRLVEVNVGTKSEYSFLFTPFVRYIVIESDFSTDKPKIYISYHFFQPKFE